MTDPTPHTPAGPTADASGDPGGDPDGEPPSGSATAPTSAAPRGGVDEPVARPTDDEAAAYLAAVRAELADLPADVVEDMVDGLAADLEETAHDTDGALADRLGPPAAYAAELRAAAGVPAAARQRAARLRARLAPARRAAAAARRVMAGPAASAWWLLRGIALASLFWVGYLWLVPGRLPWAHQVEDLVIPGVLAAAIVLASVEVGRRRTSGRVDPASARWLLRSAGLAVVVIGCLAVLRAVALGPDQAGVVRSILPAAGPVGSAVAVPLPEPTHALDGAVPMDPDSPVEQGLTYEGEHVANIFAYGPDGTPLADVRLVDDRGRMIQLRSEPFQVDRDDDGAPDGWLRYEARADSPRAPFGVFPLGEVLSPELDPTSGWQTVDAPLPVDALPPLGSDAALTADGSGTPGSSD